MPLPLEELQDRIGYHFQKIEYLQLALTHSSYAHETGAHNHHLLCNERLEFLGDSVLSLITSDYLFNRFRGLPEGDLTRLRSSTVCEEALASYATKLGLGEFLQLGKGERNSGGAEKPAVIADAFEATLAAIYLDAGSMEGMKAVSDFLIPFISEAVKDVPETGGSRSDCKSRLQEFVQKESGRLEYRLVNEFGPDHDKTFVVEVYLDSNCIGHGKGHSKKMAEQTAAKEALGLFGIEC